MQTLELAIFLQFFLGLVAAVNPVGIMPVFVSLSGHMTPEEKVKTRDNSQCGSGRHSDHFPACRSVTVGYVQYFTGFIPSGRWLAAVKHRLFDDER